MIIFLLSKDISQDIRKTIVELLKPGSSLSTISRCLKVPPSSVQRIICKFKHHGNVQPSYHSRRRRVLCPRNEHALVWKVPVSHRTKTKDFVKMLADTGKIVIIHSKRSPALKGWKATKQGVHSSPLQHKKSDYRLEMHTGTKTLIFGGKTKPSLYLEEKEELWSVWGGSIMCGGVLLQDWWTLSTRWHHEEKTLCGNTEATS